MVLGHGNVIHADETLYDLIEEIDSVRGQDQQAVEQLLRCTPPGLRCSPTPRGHCVEGILGDKVSPARRQGEHTASAVMEAGPVLMPVHAAHDQIKLLTKQWMVRMRHPKRSARNVPMRRSCLLAPMTGWRASLGISCRPRVREGRRKPRWSRRCWPRSMHHRGGVDHYHLQPHGRMTAAAPSVLATPGAA